MSTALDLRMAELARRLINDRFGKVMLLQKATSDDYDPSTGSTGTATPVRYQIKGVILDPSDNQIVAGGDIQVGDRFVMIASKGLLPDPPAPNDALIIDGDDWQILKSSPTYSGEDIAVYSVHVRT